MRQLKFFFFVFLLTFGVGVLVGSWESILVLSPEPSQETINHSEIEISNPKKVCELHGSVLRKELVQLAAGQNKKRQLSSETEFFESQLANGEKGLIFFIEYEKAWKTEFPHGYRWTYEKCEATGEQCVEVDVCHQCREKERGWGRNALKKILKAL